MKHLSINIRFTLWSVLFFTKNTTHQKTAGTMRYHTAALRVAIIMELQQYIPSALLLLDCRKRNKYSTPWPPMLLQYLHVCNSWCNFCTQLSQKSMICAEPSPEISTACGAWTPCAEGSQSSSFPVSGLTQAKLVISCWTLRGLYLYNFVMGSSSTESEGRLE